MIKKSSDAKLIYVKRWKENNPEKVKLYKKRWNEKNKKRRRIYQAKYHHIWRKTEVAKMIRKRYMIKRKELLNSLKNKCAMCDESNKNLLQFHHLNGRKPNEKCVASETSFIKIKSEASKCIVLCRECHFKIHGKRPRKRKFNCPFCKKEIDLNIMR